MRIAIFGTGGVGGLFGGRLALAAEHEVVFVARGAQLEALRRDGLRLRLPEGERTVALDAAHATDDLGAVAPVDCVLLCVKTWQVAEAARALAPLLGGASFVVPLQNGVEAARTLAGILGSGRVVGGLCGTVSFVEAPGIVRSVGTAHFVRLGELDRRPSERTERLRAALERAGVGAEIPADIEVALWEKFLFVVPVGGVGAAARAPIGALRAVPETRALLARAMREIEAVARARGIALADDCVARSLAFVDRLAPEATSSLQRDLAAGRPSELEAWNGAVVRLGRDSGVPTPVHEALYAALLPGELRARGALALPGIW
jgi:2-dehydropantoate 2-reductase